MLKIGVYIGCMFSTIGYIFLIVYLSSIFNRNIFDHMVVSVYKILYDRREKKNQSVFKNSHLDKPVLKD